MEIYSIDFGGYESRPVDFRAEVLCVKGGGGPLDVVCNPAITTAFFFKYETRQSFATSLVLLAVLSNVYHGSTPRDGKERAKVVDAGVKMNSGFPSRPETRSVMPSNGPT
jgi:hypothetical protein